MLLTKKQKRIVNMSLIIGLITLIVLGICLGIYFIVSRGKNNELTSDQLSFANVIKSTKYSPDVVDYDLSNLPSEVDPKEIVLTDEKYVATKSKNGEYSIYSLENKHKVNIDFDYVKVEEIVSNYAILACQSTKKIANLKTGKLVSDLTHASYYVSNDYILVKTADQLRVEYVPGTNTNLSAYLLDADSGNLVFEVDFDQNALDVQLFDKFFVASYADRTEVYLLDGFKLIKTYNNVVGEGTANVTSVINAKSYSLSSYYKAYDLGKCLLIENAYETENYIIEGVAGRKFDLKYSLLSQYGEIGVENGDCVVRPLKVDFSGYVALIFNGIEDKKDILETDQTVVYYSLNISKMKLKEVVRYDYYENGKIVGFEDNKLLMSGGQKSAQLTFKGEATDLIDTSKGNKISMNGYDGNIVVSSLIGLKQIYKSDGTLLVDKSFTRVSPFYDSSAIVYDGVDYYVLDKKGELTAVKLDERYVDYVFMGIGFYFVRAGQKVDVVDFKGKTLYQNADVEINIVDGKTVFVCIDAGEKKLYKITAQTQYVKSKLSDTELQITQSPKNIVASAKIETSEHLNLLADNVDEKTGLGVRRYELNYIDIPNVNFEAVGSLDAQHRALVPSASGYSVNGVHFMTSEDGTVATALTRFTRGGGYYFAITIALKDVYVTFLDGASKLDSDDSIKLYCFENGKQQLPFDYSSDVKPASMFKGRMGFADQSSGTTSVSFSSAGYDGGFVLTSEQASAVSCVIEVRNTYVGTFSSQEVKVEQTPTQSYDFGKYAVQIDEVEGGNRKLTLTCDDCYIINGFTIVYLVKTASVYEEMAEEKIENIENLGSIYEMDLDSKYEWFKIKNINLIERYHILNYYNDEQFYASTLYFFGFDRTYGVTNPAPFGFGYFSRIESITLPEKVGYDCTGFVFDGPEKTPEEETEPPEEGGEPTQPQEPSEGQEGEPETEPEEERENVVDRNGMWVGTSAFIEATSPTLQAFILHATFEPKHFKIFYESNNEILHEIETEVVYDSPVGELFNIAESEYNRINYEFAGWYTMDAAGNYDELVDEEYIYTFASDTTLYAKWEAKTFTLVFHSNIESYNNIDVKGFTYSIDSANLALAFGDKLAGDAFDTVTKDVKYDTLMGELPVVVGYNSKAASGREIYSFVGWYTVETILPDGTSAGELVTAESNFGDPDVNEEPSLDFYAVYERKVNEVDISISKGGIEDEGNAFTAFDYDGSASDGTKGAFSILDEENIWTGEEVDGVFNFKAYTIQNENLTLNIVEEGKYYIKRITITLDDGTIWTITGDWQALTPENYELVGDVSNAHLTVSKQESKTTILLSNINATTSSLIYANVEIEFEAKKYADVFEGEIENFEVTDLTDSTSPTKTSNQIIFSENYYGLDKEFLIELKGNQPLDKEYVVSDWILTSFEVLGKKLEFTPKYKNVDGVYILCLETSETVEGSWNPEKNLYSTIYTLNEDNHIELEIVFSTITNQLSYYIRLKQNETITYKIGVASVEHTSDVTTTNVGENSSANGIDVERTHYRGSAIVSSSTMLPSDTLVYAITPKQGFFISNLSLKIDSAQYTIALPSLASGGQQLSARQSVNYYASANMFTIRGNNVYLQGTNVVVEWDDVNYGFRVTINNAYVDVDVEVSYVSYRILQISVEGDYDSPYYSVSVTGGTLAGNDLKDLVDQSGGNVYEAKKVYWDRDSTFKTFFIIGLDNSISQLTISAQSGDKFMYRVDETNTYSPNEQSYSIGASQTDVVVSGACSAIFVSFEKVSIELSVESYLGRGMSGSEEIFELDPISSIGETLSKIESTYVDESGESVTNNYQSKFSVRLLGNKVSFKIYSIRGYIFKNATLTGVDHGTVVLASQTSGSDANGEYNLFEFTITNFTENGYLFKCYSSAIKYQIKYDPSDTADFVATGSTPNSVHYYNVFSRLSVNGYERFGFTFHGYSLTSPAEKEGGVLDEGDVDFTSGQPLEQNLTDHDGDIITLYAVFTANDIRIQYHVNDSTENNGSSPSTNPSGVLVAVYGAPLGDLGSVQRQGYNFIGWFSRATGGRQVRTGDTLDEELFQEVSEDGHIVNLYARWQALTYNFFIHKNDSTENGGVGSTEATFSGQQTFSVEYDGNFPSSMPTLSRMGYNFLGYKSKKLTSAQAQTDALLYIGVGTNAVKKLTYNMTNTGLDLSNNETTIEIYAVWSAIAVDFYVNLNNENLKTYQQSDGNFSITYKGQSISSSNSFVNFSFPVEFDGAIGELPNVVPIGYTFIGFYTEKGDGLSTPKGQRVTSTMKLDADLVEILNFTDKNGTTNKLSEIFPTTRSASIYAYYEKVSYAVSYNGTEKNSLKTVSNYSKYSHSSNSTANNKTSLDFSYGDDVILDIFVEEGNFVRTLTIFYMDNSNIQRSVVVIFTWNNGKYVTMSVESSGISGSSNSNNNFIQIKGNTQYVAAGMYLKMLPYNRKSSADADNSVVDAVRIIVGFDGLKTNVDITASSARQTYEIAYYKFLDGGDSCSFWRTAEIYYGDRVSNSTLNYEYVSQYKLESYYYGSLDKSGALENPNENSQAVKLGDVMTDNLILIAYYVISNEQSVSFFFYDWKTDSYTTRAETNAQYVLRDSSGSNKNAGEHPENYDAAKGLLKRLPDPSSEAWPEGTCFAGWVIASSAPASGYYSWNSSNTNGLQILTTSTIIDSAISVYAVFNPIKVDLNVSYDSASKSYTLEPDVDLYDYNADGSVTPTDLTTDPIYYIVLTENQLETYTGYLSNPDESRETALRRAVGDLKSAVAISSALALASSTERQYVFAFSVKKGADGKIYITYVSDHYYELNNGRVTSHAN